MLSFSLSVMLKLPACRTLENAQKLVQGIPHTNLISLDVTDAKALDEQVAKHDLVISLIPYSHHVAVVKSAIKHKKHVVTTSYISPAMAELDDEAKCVDACGHERNRS